MPAPRAARAAAARQAIAPPADQSGGRARKQGEGNVVIWPYVSFDDGPTVETPGSDASSVAPNVIVVGNVPAPGATPSGEQTLPDYSYVPGCRAIPNGYACDTHEHEAAP